MAVNTYSRQARHAEHLHVLPGGNPLGGCRAESLVHVEFRPDGRWRIVRRLLPQLHHGAVAARAVAAKHGPASVAEPGDESGAFGVWRLVRLVWPPSKLRGGRGNCLRFVFANPLRDASTACASC